MASLRVLVVDDSDDDAAIVVRELRRGKRAVETTRVDSASGLRTALGAESWDAITCDWSMPSFSALQALAIVRELGLDVPFIIVSGTVDEESAVAAMRAGAHDYVLKDRLARLAPALEREILDCRARAARREVEAALRERELRFQRLFDSGMLGIAILDGDGQVLEANDTLLETVGYTRADLESGKLDATALTPPEWHTGNELAREQLAERGFSRPWEKEYLRKDGTRVPVLVGVATLEGKRTISVSASLSELRTAQTARVELETQLRQAQKMEAIGNLAGGVAHDFNNLLSVVLSYSEMIIGDLRPNDPIRGDLEEIQQAGRRAAELTRQLLAFSRQQILQPKLVELPQIVEGVERMLRRLIGEDVELAIMRGVDTGRILADASQVEQVIVNLVVNARDAMLDGGKITIETARIRLDERYTSEHADVAPGDYVMLAVSDTGIGMSDETRARIFEPFFTTKEQGKGTGLGLSTVFGIVSQSGGHVWVYSEPGEGSTFKVYFPVAAPGSIPPLEAPVAADAPSLRGNETILLVEDDVAVRALARSILARHGYHVLEAQNGGDALLICEQHTASIHLMLTDVVMPRMSGRQLAERLRPMRPEMKVLFMSGYTDGAIVYHGVLDSGVEFLQKPITPALLARRVREVLGARA